MFKNLFKKNKQLRMLSLSALLLSAFGLVAAFVAMGTALSIKEANHFWDVNVLDATANTKGFVAVSGLEVSSTSLNNMDITFEKKGTATYKFRIRNSGAVDAVLKYINITKDSCVADHNSCDEVSYKLTYNDGREVVIGDVINSGTNMEINLVVDYNGATEGVIIKGLDLVLLYEQA